MQAGQEESWRFLKNGTPFLFMINRSEATACDQESSQADPCPDLTRLALAIFLAFDGQKPSK